MDDRSPSTKVCMAVRWESLLHHKYPHIDNWDSQHEKCRTHCYVLPCTISCNRHCGFYDADAIVSIPLHLWIACAGLFNPQSFLTAIMQTTARQNGWPLDKLTLLTEVTRKTADQIDGPSKDGAYIHGLVMEGARWDEKAGAIADSRPKELSFPMPVGSCQMPSKVQACIPCWANEHFRAKYRRFLCVR